MVYYYALRTLNNFMTRLQIWLSCLGYTIARSLVVRCRANTLWLCYSKVADRIYRYAPKQDEIQDGKRWSIDTCIELSIRVLCTKTCTDIPDVTRLSWIFVYIFHKTIHMRQFYDASERDGVKQQLNKFYELFFFSLTFYIYLAIFVGVCTIIVVWSRLLVWKI